MNQKQPHTLPPEYFDRVYKENIDPWEFETSEYEHEKYRATLAALPQERYQTAFEVGCSIGVLTELLAARCDALLSVDVSEKALARARERCRNLPNVRFENRRFPVDFPDQNFDLILISEVGYYLAPDDWQKAAEKIVGHLEPGATVALVHWTPPVHDFPQTGDEVHESFKLWTRQTLRHLREQRREEYRLDVWERM